MYACMGTAACLGTHISHGCVRRRRNFYGSVLNILSIVVNLGPIYSHLVMAFVFGPVDSTDAPARIFFRSRARLPAPRVPAVRQASLHVLACMCGNGSHPIKLTVFTCCELAPSSASDDLLNLVPMYTCT
jgi:hypothetical protein